MTDTTPGGWPDAARELVEWALAVHFSGDRTPHMSGDPRNRLSPGRRRAMEDARDAVLEALAPILAAQVEAARREEREACAQVVLRGQTVLLAGIGPVDGNPWDNAAKAAAAIRTRGGPRAALKETGHE
jgi:hypothetical protein